MVPMNSAWVVSYSTSIDSVMVSVTIFQIFECNFNDLELGQFKVIQGPRSWCQLIAHELFCIRLILTTSSYMSPFLKYLTYYFDDFEVELGLSNVIQGQSSWWQSEAFEVSYLTPLYLTLHNSRYSRYLMRNYCDLDLGRFKFIQGPRSWCQLIAHG